MKKIIKKMVNNNSGFTLIELIIVIATIVIMTGASFVTLTVMHTAKAKEAASTFEDALSELASTAKNKGIDYNLDGTIDDSEKKYAPGIKLYYDNNGDKNKIYLQKCVFIAQPDGSYALWNLGADDPYIQSVNAHNGKGECLSSYIQIKMESISGTEYTLGGYNVFAICYNKKGECVSGYGTYKFSKKGGTSISRVQINKNGSYITDAVKDR